MRRRAIPSIRWLAVVVVSGLVLAGCAGADVLFQLGATVDLYFTQGDFDVLEVMDAARVVGKVLGTGSF